MYMNRLYHNYKKCVVQLTNSLSSETPSTLLHNTLFTVNYDNHGEYIAWCHLMFLIFCFCCFAELKRKGYSDFALRRGSVKL